MFYKCYIISNESDAIAHIYIIFQGAFIMMLIVSIGETFVFGTLIAASILGLAVGIERVVVFRRNKVKIPDSFLSEIGLKLRRHDISGAQEFVKQVGGGVYCRFVEFALQKLRRRP